MKTMAVKAGRRRRPEVGGQRSVVGEPLVIRMRRPLRKGLAGSRWVVGGWKKDDGTPWRWVKLTHVEIPDLQLSVSEGIVRSYFSARRVWTQIFCAERRAA